LLETYIYTWLLLITYYHISDELSFKSDMVGSWQKRTFRKFWQKN